MVAAGETPYASTATAAPASSMYPTRHMKSMNELNRKLAHASLTHTRHEMKKRISFLFFFLFKVCLVCVDCGSKFVRILRVNHFWMNYAGLLILTWNEEKCHTDVIPSYYTTHTHTHKHTYVKCKQSNCMSSACQQRLSVHHHQETKHFTSFLLNSAILQYIQNTEHGRTKAVTKQSKQEYHLARNENWARSEQKFSQKRN